MDRPLPRMSPEIEQLLAAEREIVSLPEPLRRRADLRARTALWHVRRDEVPRGAGAALWFKRMGLVLAGLLIPSLSFAAWLALDRAPEHEALAEDASTPSEPASFPEGARNTRPAEPEVTLPVPDNGPERQAAVKPSDSNGPQVASRGSAASVTRKPSSPGHKASRSREPLADELATLDSARKAVARGEYRGALQQLANHERRFPSSELAEERDALRVRALKGAGLSDQANRAAKGFESRHPNSVLVPSLKHSQ